MDYCKLAAAVIVVATEAGEKQDPDNPFATVIVATVVTAATTENSVTVAAASATAE